MLGSIMVRSSDVVTCKELATKLAILLKKWLEEAEKEKMNGGYWI